MGEPRRVQLSRKKGWRIPDDTVNVARPGKWGNPFIVNPAAPPGSKSGAACICVPTVADAAECFREMVHSEGDGAQSRRDKLHELRGKNLACWCELGSVCHADVLLELANAPLPSDKEEYNG